jgi:parallel beta-helix repeat protein
LLSTGIFGFVFISSLVDEQGTVSASSSIYVDKKGHGNYTTIQEAIDNATNGDTIHIWSGIYLENVIVNKTLTLIGNGSENTFVVGNSSKYGIEITTDYVNVTNLTVYNSQTGITINNASNALIENCTFNGTSLGIEINGLEDILFEDNFSTDKGWTGYGGSGEWERGPATAGGNDPGYDHSPSNDNFIIGNDLGGDYANSLSSTYYLTSPVIDCTGINNVFFKFYRWLDMESSYYDHAYVSAYDGNSWNVIWQNPDTDIWDINWKPMIFDVSEFANNNPSFRIRFGIGPTDMTGSYFGWNIDDVKIMSYLQVGLSKNNIIQNNNCSNNEQGMVLTGIKNNIIQNNTCYKNLFNGIQTIFSIDNLYYNNNCSENYGIGIELLDSYNNEVIKNICKSNRLHGIRLYRSQENKFEFNNCSSNWNNGIIFVSGLNNSVRNNLLDNNYWGLYLQQSSFNVIENNNITNNDVIGIYLLNSNENMLFNNTCTGNAYGYGIYLYNSSNCILIGNNCSDNYWGYGIALSLSSYNIFNNNICSNNLVGIYDYYSSNNSIIKNLCNFNSDYGIILTSSEWENITDNTCNSNDYGVLIQGDSFVQSNNNTVSGNTCSYNDYALYLDYISVDNIIMRNTFEFSIVGIYLYFSNRNIIIENDLNNNGDGLQIWISNENSVLRNNCSSNSNVGITLGSSYLNTISENTCNINEFAGINLQWSSYSNEIIDNECNSNNWTGIWTEGTYSNIFENNTCSQNNRHGIYLYNTYITSIKNNNFSSNLLNGIELDVGYSNLITNNTSKKNDIGINISHSWQNFIQENSLIKNNYGININNYSEQNNFSKNMIADNNVGVYFENNAYNNSVFHNMIIDNIIQAIDKDNNHWNNSYQEGNYWSDYTGKDNGANGRVAGDGIGDTLLPHYGLDNYPFINPDGWVVLRAPKLFDPGDVDLDGKYNVSWVPSGEFTGFVLQEDDNKDFNSPNEIYNGTGLSFEVSGRKDGIYYYRVKSYNELTVSSWSNIVDITVNQKPPMPQNLQVEAWYEGNALNISWKLGANDIEYYELKYRTTSNVVFTVNITHPIHTFNHTGLTDGIRYYYSICAHDNLNRLSGFCAEVSGIPEDTKSPDPPIDIQFTDITYNSLMLSWNASTDADVAGYNIYSSKKPNVNTTGKLVNTNGPIVDTFYRHSGLDEGTTYYYQITAIDEVPNESRYSTEIHGRTFLFNEYPQPPESTNPPPDFSMPEDNIDNSSIRLYDWFTDVNNDKLYFYCSGNEHINVTIDQITGHVILSPEHDWSGSETLTFLVLDGRFNVTDTIIVTVTPVNDPPQMLRIISPSDGSEILNGTTVDFSATCTDPDILYGDIITYQWYSSKSGELGSGRNINGVSLPAGKHMISVVATDKNGATSSAAINITITSSDKPSDTKDNAAIINLVIGLIIIIIVVIIIGIFLMRRSKKTTSPDAEVSETLQQTDEIKTVTEPWEKLGKRDLTIEQLEDLYLQEEQ